MAMTSAPTIQAQATSGATQAEWRNTHPGHRLEHMSQVAYGPTPGKWFDLWYCHNDNVFLLDYTTA